MATSPSSIPRGRETPPPSVSRPPPARSTSGRGWPEVTHRRRPVAGCQKATTAVTNAGGRWPQLATASVIARTASSRPSPERREARSAPMATAASAPAAVSLPTASATASQTPSGLSAWSMKSPATS